MYWWSFVRILLCIISLHYSRQTVYFYDWETWKVSDALISHNRKSVFFFFNLAVVAVAAYLLQCVQWEIKIKKLRKKPTWNESKEEEQNGSTVERRAFYLNYIVVPIYIFSFFYSFSLITQRRLHAYLHAFFLFHYSAVFLLFRVRTLICFYASEKKCFPFAYSAPSIRISLTLCLTLV